MATNDTQKELIKLRRSAMNPGNKPKTRVASIRKALVEHGFSDRNLRIAKRVAKTVLKDPEADRTAKYAATNLLLFCEDQRLTDEDIEATEGVPDDDVQEIVEKAATIPQLPREVELAKRNAKWNGVNGPDGVCIEPPCKFLHYVTAEDLIPFGVSDLDSPDSRYFAPMGESEPMSFGMSKRIVNPKYLEAFRAWKQRRFNGELPGRTSVWFGLFEVKPECYEPNPELYTGQRLMKYMLDNKQITRWEYDCGFLRDLWYEIFLCGPGSQRANDEAFKNDFVWTE